MKRIVMDAAILLGAQLALTPPAQPIIPSRRRIASRNTSHTVVYDKDSPGSRHRLALGKWNAVLPQRLRQ